VDETFRNGQQAALEIDVIQLMEVLEFRARSSPATTGVRGPRVAKY
jgi:hypothetical protein